MKELLNNLTINFLGKDTILLSNASVYFCYTIADSVVKDEYKGKYRYFGGMQCDLEEGTDGYRILEDQLCRICESLLK